MVDEAYVRALAEAEKARSTLTPERWELLVQVARDVVWDAMSWDDVPAVALALARMEKLGRALEGGHA